MHPAAEHPSAGSPMRLTGVELHRILFMGVIGGGAVPVPVTLPIIVSNKNCKQDDGDNLQSQGHNGELQPHVGGVRRHPETNSALSV